MRQLQDQPDFYFLFMQLGLDGGPTVMAEFIKEQLTKSKQKKNAFRWTSLSLRVFLSIYHRSKSAYQALRTTTALIMPHHVAAYKDFCANAAKSAQEDVIDHVTGSNVPKVSILMPPRRSAAPPAGVGMLILDEVKISARIAFHSSSNEFIGLLDEGSSYSSLSDVFHELVHAENGTAGSTFADSCHEPLTATYSMVILWRDLTSLFRFIPAYFNSSKLHTAAQVVQIILDTMLWCAEGGFMVDIIIADGASTNFAAFKSLCAKEDWVTQPWFLNRHTGRKVFCAFDPSHLLKSSRNSLYHSRLDMEHRSMLIEGCPAVWDHLVSVFTWDQERTAATGDLRMTVLSADCLELDGFAKMRVPLALRVIDKRVVCAMADQAALVGMNNEIVHRRVSPVFSARLDGHKAFVRRPCG